MTITRRALFGRKASPAVFRPPWAIGEAQFTNACDGCGKCIAICPEKILEPTSDDLVALSFDHAGCTFCGECAAICPTGALSKSVEPALAMKAKIQGSCIALHGVVCRLCEDACEVSAIRFRPGLNGKSYPLLQGDACTGCGVCVPRCPSKAILMTENGSQQDQIKVVAG